MKINSLSLIHPIRRKNKKINYIMSKSDIVSFGNKNFDKKVLIKRGIIKQNQDIDLFFDKITNDIFQRPNKEFSTALKNGEISLSTSCYSNLKNPSSAIAVALDSSKTITFNLLKLQEKIENGKGIGINFSNFNEPTKVIKEVNDYFKYKEDKAKRPPAGIALLNINHPKILDFIKLKDDKDYSKWCFDLSVVIDDEFFNKLKNYDKTALETYSTLINSMKKSGEPGIIFSNDKNYLCDCCACAPLKENENLTLSHLNLSKYVENNKFNYKKLEKNTQLLSDALKIIDKNSYIGILGYQELLDKLNIKYGSVEALNILEKSLSIIQKSAHKNNLKTAISPTGNTSKLLKTTPSIEPKKSDYLAEIKTMTIAQKYLDGNISKTILLDKNATVDDVDKIIKLCFENKLKGISVYPN